jgi:hypothetical protein
MPNSMPGIHVCMECEFRWAAGCIVTRLAPFSNFSPPSLGRRGERLPLASPTMQPRWGALPRRARRALRRSTRGSTMESEGKAQQTLLLACCPLLVSHASRLHRWRGEGKRFRSPRRRCNRVGEHLRGVLDAPCGARPAAQPWKAKVKRNSSSCLLADRYPSLTPFSPPSLERRGERLPLASPPMQPRWEAPPRRARRALRCSSRGSTVKSEGKAQHLQLFGSRFTWFLEHELHTLREHELHTLREHEWGTLTPALAHR